MSIPGPERRKGEARSTEDRADRIRREKTLTRIQKRLAKQVVILRREAIAPHERVKSVSKPKSEDTGRPSFAEALRLLKRLHLERYKRFAIVEPILELYPKTQARKFVISNGSIVPKI